MIDRKVIFWHGCEKREGTILDKIRIKNYSDAKANADAYVIADEKGDIYIVTPSELISMISKSTD